jgi:hypothetical protein
MRPKEALALLNFHWDDAYRIAIRDGTYTATAKFGKCDVLSSDDPDELLRQIRQHYPGPSERSST